MTEPTHRPQAPGAEDGPVTRFLRATEIDPRLLGMVGALALIWLAFEAYSTLVLGRPSMLLGAAQADANGFITPRNLWNLSVQTSYIGIMATGMVLVIITRNIDLSVGSIMGMVGMYMGLLQVEWLAPALGMGHPSIWIITVMFGIAMGTLIGAFQGALIAFLGIPSFIVTLGGLLVWRGAAFLVAGGKTIAPLDDTFSLIGGGSFGSLGTTGSWIFAVIACVFVVLAFVNGRKARRRHGFALRPVWAETFVIGLVCSVIIGATAVVNSYIWPRGNIAKYYAALGQEPPACAESNDTINTGVCATFGHGFAYPVLIMIAVAIFMTILMTQTRFGRYVFAIGGNPEAASLSGINTRAMTVKIFALMGGLAGIAAVIGSARQNSATNAMGNLDELYVIAAAVVGGTSLAGGVGTIYGAIIGALILTSLQTGMVLIGFGDGSYQRIVIGIALVFAVWLDIVYRKRIK
ncbi:MAG: sugar ABC transporter permease [Rhodobacter sp.]|nr:sugar ABC transporter permease [Rhodobacter sp.]MCA3457102.1 sugar ABC transporter permease [Rhodobacter sp.]MCA3460886.1 sugar ABC transporter permease [Rhodobacter sp.]MCA3462850.1 sugar ABC transporter permease [Rhodobacter sp.]MCA3466416.1 sugar ABC transporter permease [Rhodobacter sp.]